MSRLSTALPVVLFSLTVAGCALPGKYQARGEVYDSQAAYDVFVVQGTKGVSEWMLLDVVRSNGKTAIAYSGIGSLGNVNAKKLILLTCPSVRERKADMASTTNVVECTAMDFVSKKLIYSGVGEYMGLGDEDTLRGSVSASLETLWRAGAKVSAASLPVVPAQSPQEQEKGLYAAYPYARLVFPQINETDVQFKAVMDERRTMIKAEAKRRLKSDHPDATGAQADNLYREYLAKLSQQYGPSWFPNADLAASGPAISIPELTIRTTASTAAVAGRVVSKGTISSLTVDGKEAPIDNDGTFSFQRSVPVGESALKLVATDEWGQRGETTIKVIRSIASTIPDYPALTPAKVKAKPRPNAVALIIGVDGYQSIPRAEFAENDARFFYDYSINALGVPKDRIKLLTGAEARKLDIEKALLTWLKPLAAGGKSDIFVFFSGHGLASDDGRDLFLLPYDGDRSLIERSAIRRKELVDAIVGAGAVSATLFLDTCYSGGTRSGETLVASARPVLLAAKEEAVPVNVTILTAAANDQLSSTLPATGHGLFSYYLMRGLEGEAAGGGRSLTASDLLGYLSFRIPPEAAKLGRSQTPQVVGDGNRVISTW